MTTGGEEGRATARWRRMRPRSRVAVDRAAMRRYRAAFRAWRRSRPFWGGLLLLISGLELVSLPLSGVLTHGALKLVIYIGIGGVFGILIGVLLIAAGIMCWADRAHRIFYGITGIVLGILSFPASNLGGFFLGMLLAIVGGSLAFAWTQIEPLPAPATSASADEPTDTAVLPPSEEEPSAGLDLITGPESQTPDEDDQETRGTNGAAYRTLAIAAMPALLVAGLMTAPVHTASADSTGICILGIICIGGSSSPSASASASASASSESADATASPCATASSTASPSPSPSPTCSPSASASASAGASPSPGTSASPTASSSGSSSTKSSTKKAAVKAAAADPSLEASNATSVLTAGSATLSNFTFDGLVDMPVAGGGTVQMMKFSASSADLTGNVTVTVTQNGTTSVTESPSLSFSGDMTLYATKLSGTLLGIPLTFTPSTVSAVLLTIANLLTSVVPITMTNVTTDQPLALAGGLQTGALTIGFL